MLRVEYNNSYDDYNENINKILNCNNFGEYIATLTKVIVYLYFCK